MLAWRFWRQRRDAAAAAPDRTYPESDGVRAFRRRVADSRGPLIMRSAKAVFHLLGLALLVPATLQAQQHVSPYAGHQDREIKALSAEDVEALLNGEGMGMALPAELSGYPGPRHVLELAAQLELSTEQTEATQRIYDSMKQQAVELGKRIVELERQLDQAFAGRTIDHDQLGQLTGEIARLNGQLRAVHLGAHLELAGILSDSQRDAYAKLRGYDHPHQ